MQVLTNHLKAALLAAGKRDIRKRLNSVYIDGDNIVGTDGSRMHVIAHRGEWAGAPVIIPREAVELAIKGRATTVEITATQIGQVAYTEIPEAYPDYRRVMVNVSPPMDLGALIANLQPDLALDAQKAIALVTGRQMQCLARVAGKWVWSSPDMHVVVMPFEATKTSGPIYSLEKMK